MSNSTIPLLLIIDGLICIFSAIYAHAFGLDPNAAWGRTRFALLLLGMALALLSLYIFFSKRIKGSFFDPILKLETVKIFFVLAHLWVIILTVYVWFITFGNFTTWTHTTHYYTLLADAFSKGQLFVDINPGKALLDAVDPYDPNTRAPFQDEIWDMSYYQGKLYYYWGPVPALIIMPIQVLFDTKVADNYLVLLFFAGLLVVNSLIILKLWRRFFAGISAWNALLGILLIGLALPILWETGVPNVYGAAIGAGQFFLIGGVYFAISVFEQNTPSERNNLFLAGVFWVCSVGSRAVNVFSVIFFSLLITFWIIKKIPKPVRWTEYIHQLAALYIPLIVGAIALGWYNWARFDSPLEFGVRFMVTTYNLNARWNEVFQLKYFFSNLYAYFFQPFGLISKFPFIEPVVLPGHIIKTGNDATQIYYAGRTTGILFSIPFLILGLIPMFSKNNLVQEKIKFPVPQSYSYIVLLLTGSGLIGFITILFFFNAQTRFLLDVISQITLLAILGYWELVSNRLKLNSSWLKLAVTLANLLVILTLVVGFLLAVSGETSRLEALNPLLFEKINGFPGIP